jgi:hypothetical protein
MRGSTVGPLVPAMISAGRVPNTRCAICVGDNRSDTAVRCLYGRDDAGLAAIVRR